MRSRGVLLLVLLAVAGRIAADDAIIGPGVRRIANMPDGAPTFVVTDAHGAVVRRVECINNHQFDPDSLAARFIGSIEVLDRIARRDGRIGNDDLGPAGFDCIVVMPP